MAELTRETSRSSLDPRWDKRVWKVTGPAGTVTFHAIVSTPAGNGRSCGFPIIATTRDGRDLHQEGDDLAGFHFWKAVNRGPDDVVVSRVFGKLTAWYTDRLAPLKPQVCVRCCNPIAAGAAWTDRGDGPEHEDCG